MIILPRQARDKHRENSTTEHLTRCHDVYPVASSDQGESNVACSDVWGYSQGGNCAMSPSDCADYYACQFPAMIEVRETAHALLSGAIFCL